MIIIGCDFHTRFQQIAMVDTTIGEIIERRLEHEKGEARKFYATLPGPARVEMEATIDAQWLERKSGLAWPVVVIPASCCSGSSTPSWVPLRRLAGRLG